jgi:sporulation protein YlmC with PRC-barrel domain/tellurite resistance protein
MISKTSLANLKFKPILDAQGNEIGKIKNAVINKENLDIRGFVVYGSTTEEILESLKLRKDIDHLITSEVIESVDDYNIRLNKNKEELVNIMQPGELKENEVLFKDFKTQPVYEKSTGQNIGMVKDIHFDNEGKHSFSLGGPDFNQFLKSRGYTTTLDYCLYPEDISIEADGWIVKSDLGILEKNLKQNLTNIIRELLITAGNDGKISPEEQALINQVRVDLGTYNEALEEALEDGVITAAELKNLEKIKDQLILNAVNLANQDNKIDSDESALIRKLAAYMVDKRRKLFWSVFGTHRY